MSRRQHVRLRRPRGEAARFVERLRKVVPEGAQVGELEVWRNRAGRLIVAWGDFIYTPLDGDGEIVAQQVDSDETLLITAEGAIVPWVDAETDNLCMN